MGKILNKRSNVVENGKAKLPTPSQLDYGEIAINFAAGKETISIKNSNDEIVTFPTNSQLEEIEFVTANALNEHDFALIQIDNALRQISNEYATSADTYNAIINASGDIKSYVDNKVSSVYTYKGSVTNYSDLASITTKEVGDVYNVVNANGSTPVGTNYAWTGTEWDALGGTINLSNYVENSSFTAHTGNSAIHLTTGDVETQITSHNYLTGYTETDPTVPNWAKQPAKPTYTASEVGALPTGTTLDSIADGSTRKLSDYATQANFTAHTASTTVHVSSTEKSTWNGKQDAISDLSTIRTNAESGANAYTAVTAHTGNTTIHLPSVTSQDNGKILQVVNGQWVLTTPSTIYTGQGSPDNLLGIDGDIYLQTS